MHLSKWFSLLATAAFLVTPVSAQVLTVWNGGDGLWNNSANWSTGAVPSSATADVTIDSLTGTDSTVTMNLGARVGRLRLDVGDRLEVGENVSLILDDSGFTGAGEILVNGVLMLPFGSSVLDGPKTVNGGGKVIFGAAYGQSNHSNVYDDITNNAVIEGTARFGAYNTTKPRIVNNGTIDANVPGKMLELRGREVYTAATDQDNLNTGILKSSGGGILYFGEGDWINSDGEIIADGAGSEVYFGERVDITGGSISAIDGGLLRVSNGGPTWRDLTLSGPTAIDGNPTVHLIGTFTNNGVMTIGGTTASLTSYAPFTASGPRTTIAGSGEIIIDRTPDRNSSVIGDVADSWLIQDQTIRGRGTIGRWNGDGQDIINRGTFQADRDGQMLHIEVKALDNQSGGKLRAIDGGILRLNVRGPALANTGGTIEALNGGRLEAGFARIEGGLIRNLGGFIPLGGMTLVNPGTGMRLEGDLKLGLPTTWQQARLVNEIENTGTIRIAGTSSSYYAELLIGENASPSVTLTGGGEVVMGDPATGSPDSRITEPSYDDNLLRTLYNLNNTIRGFGRIGDASTNRVALHNTALLTADVPGKLLHVALREADNTGGTFRAENGGNLQFRTTAGFDNVGGVIEALTGGAVGFSWRTDVSGGILRNNGGSFDLAYGTIINPGSGVILQGPLHVSTAREARLVGTITNEGSITTRSANQTALLLIGRTGDPNVILSGGGEVIVGDPSIEGSGGRVMEGTDAALLQLDDQTLRGFGLVGETHGSYRQLNMINNGLIDADENGKTLQLSLVSLLNSPAKITKASNGGTLVLDANTLTNTGASILATTGSTVSFGGDGNHRTLTGGLVQSAPSGTLNVHSGLKAEGGAILQNDGVMNLGLGWTDHKLTGFANGGAQLINPGTIRKHALRNYTIDIPINHTGALFTEGNWLSLEGGGSISNGTITTSAEAETRLQVRPFAVSGAGNVFDGAGKVRLSQTTLTLADVDTKIAATHLQLAGTTSIAGPGTTEISGGITLDGYGVNANVSGGKLVQLASANGKLNTASGFLRLTEGAEFRNEGALLLGAQYGRTELTGEAGTLFNNTGTLINQGTNTLNVPFLNTGTIQANAYTLDILNAVTFSNATMTIASSAAVEFEGASLNLEGTENVFSGAGLTRLKSSTMSFAPEAELEAARLEVSGASTITGAGLLNIAGDLQFVHSYTPKVTLNGARVHLKEGSTGKMNYFSSSTHFESGAALDIGGDFTIQGSPEIISDGTGRLNILPSGRATFGTMATVPLKLFLEGMMEVTAATGRTVTFDKGGEFHHTAKVLPQLGAKFSFTGPDPWITRGQAVEFNGTGSVQFLDTTLRFEDADPTTSADDPTINAGAAVAFQGTNTVSGTGTLGTTAFYFQAGNLTVDGSTLHTSGTAGTSQWNNPGGKLMLTNGARFLNDGQFSINTSVGPLVNAPGIIGDAGTLFHNMPNGRLIHNTNTPTEFAVDFQNDGELEFHKGTVKFLNKFSGNGGMAAFNGAKVTLSLTAAQLEELPHLLRTFGAGSEISIILPEFDNMTLRVDLNGGKIVAAGGLNLVAAGGLNMVAAGAGNLVAAGGLNLVAAGGGNITATGIASLIEAHGGNIVAAGGGNILSHNGGQIVAAGGGNILSHNGGQIVAAGAGNVMATGGGQIVAAGAGNLLPEGGGNFTTASVAPFADSDGGILSGDGTFTGPGVIQSGGALKPGSSPGTLTWDGPLDVQDGGLLEIELAGLLAGSEYDVLNVSGSFHIDGILQIKFLAGFESFVSPADTFHVVNAGAPISGIIQNVTDGRIGVAGGFGTFAVSFTNGGQTLMLSDYQPLGKTFDRWAQEKGLVGTEAEMTADSDGDGFQNLLEYALGLDPMASGGSVVEAGAIEEAGSRYLSLSYTRPTGEDEPLDLFYLLERSNVLDPTTWSPEETVLHGVANGPGEKIETVTVRSIFPISSQSQEFLRLRVEPVPAPAGDVL